MLPSPSCHLSTHQKGGVLDTPDLFSFHSGGNLLSAARQLRTSFLQPCGAHASSFKARVESEPWTLDTDSWL